MSALPTAARARRPAFLHDLRQLVSAESPSATHHSRDSSPAANLAALKHCAELLAAQARAIVPGIRIHRIPTRAHGAILHFTATLPGARPRKPQSLPAPILCLGHYDTVYPLGTLRSQPFRLTPSRAYGPGTLDMKSGLLLFFHALALLQAQDGGAYAARTVSLLVVPDEEIGSPASRAVTEKFARRLAAQKGFVLVLEPATASGALKTARKGIADYTLTIRGRAAHSGVDFAAGASAILEAARQTERIAGLSRPASGLTLNPGILRGGTALNIVAPLATLDFEARLSRMRDFAPLERRLRRLRAFDPRCTLALSGGLNRPPMERTPRTARLYSRAATLAREQLGQTLTEAATGGASDGNFTAALGLPTLDGLGPTGAGAHCPGEHILLSSVAPRMALIALLLSQLKAR
jgi:glutamate carboxypeptidase